MLSGTALDIVLHIWVPQPKLNSEMTFLWYLESNRSFGKSCVSVHTFCCETSPDFLHAHRRFWNKISLLFRPLPSEHFFENRLAAVFPLWSIFTQGSVQLAEVRKRSVDFSLFIIFAVRYCNRCCWIWKNSCTLANTFRQENNSLEPWFFRSAWRCFYSGKSTISISKIDVVKTPNYSFMLDGNHYLPQLAPRFGLRSPRFPSGTDHNCRAIDLSDKI